MKFRFLVLAAIAMFFTSACSENVDPDAAKVDLKMQAITQLGTLNSGARTAATEIEFTEAIIGVTKIEFESSDDSSDDDNSGSGSDDDDDDDDDGDDDDGDDDNDDDSDDDGDEMEVEIKGKFIVDLIAGTSNPDFGVTGIAPGTYNKLEIKMRPILQDGNTLKVVFNYSIDGAAPVTIEISTKQELEFEIESNSTLDLSEVNAKNILILFDLDRLIAGVDFTSGVKSPDGIVRINESSNTSLAAKLLGNLDDCMDAGEDDDEDDEIDD